jgi:hypothetical protein
MITGNVIRKNCVYRLERFIILLKGNMHHKYNICLKCTFYTAISAGGFYFELLCMDNE